MSDSSKEDLEEMCGDDIIEQLAFLSGCHQHQLCNSNPSGWIITDESLRKFAELIIAKCIEKAGDPADGLIKGNTWHDGVRASVLSIKQHFGGE